MYDKIYLGTTTCSNCGGTHSLVKLDDSTTISEFSYNYYIPNGKCSYPDEDRYCVLVRWNDFILNPEEYIEKAYAKRNNVIANNIKVRP